MIRIKTNEMAVEYLAKDGSIGVPTGERTSGGAKAIFGDGEIFMPHLAMIKKMMKPDGTIIDFCTEPVDVKGYDEPVVFYLFEKEQIEKFNKEAR